MKRPLIHIGYHKTGSTWLQKEVFYHREMGFCCPLDYKRIAQLIAYPHPLDFDFTAVCQAIEEALQQADASDLTPVISHERLCGIAYGGGYDSATLADRLVKLFPEGRILLVIREQKAIIASFHNQYVKKGGSLSLRRYLNSDNRRYLPLFRFEHFMYDRLIKHYQQLFGEANLLVLPYELFHQAPQDFLRRIFEFCELPVPKASETLDYKKRTNKSLTPVEVAYLWRLNTLVNVGNQPSASLIYVSARMWQRLANAKRFVRRAAPERLQNRLGAHYKETLAQEVGNRYAESNLETERLIGFDLKAFGYDTAR